MSGLPRVVCPACQVEMGLEAILGSDDARGVVALMARMPGTPALRKGVLRYVGLHAPAQRQISWDKVEKLISEVVEMMDAGSIQRDGRTWPAPLAYWSDALDKLFVIPTLRRPLKGHGLLLQIIADMAAGDDAKAEVAKLRTGRGETPIGTSAAHKEFAPEVGRKSGSIAPSAARKPKQPAPVSLAETLKSLNLKEPHDGR